MKVSVIICLIVFSLMNFVLSERNERTGRYDVLSSAGSDTNNQEDQFEVLQANPDKKTPLKRFLSKIKTSSLYSKQQNLDVENEELGKSVGRYMAGVGIGR